MSEGAALGDGVSKGGLVEAVDDDPLDINQGDSPGAAAFLEHFASSRSISFYIVLHQIHILGLEKLSGLSAVASPPCHIHYGADALGRFGFF